MSSTKTTRRKRKSRLNWKQKVLVILFLVLTVLNFVGLHTLWRTDISYLKFFLFSFLLSIILMISIALLLIRKKRWGTNRDAILVSIPLGYSLYMLTFSLFPFVANYYGSSGEVTTYTITSFQRVVDDYEDEQTGQWNYYERVVFHHNGVRFKLGAPRGDGDFHYTTQQGLFGLTVIKDWYFENDWMDSVD